jgi:K+-transporting ATPase ATPase A chain
LRWCEAQLNTGPQNWKQYTLALLVFNTVMFVFGYLALALQQRYGAQASRHI